MPDFEITSPDGKKFVVTAPEGATQDQVLSYAQSQYKAPPAPEPSMLDKAGRQLGLTARAGITGLADLTGGTAIGNALGMDTSGALQRNLTRIGLPEPQNSGERVAQSVAGAMAGQGGLMKAGSVLAGSAGPVARGVGDILTAQPLAQVTGAAGAAGGSSTAKEMGLGPVGQGIAGLAGGIAGTMAGVRSVPNTVDQAQNATRDAILKKAQEAGYGVPPTMINQNIVNNALESVAGKAATQQALSLQNQKLTDTLARESLGLKPDAALTEGGLSALRAKAGQAYQAVKDFQTPFKVDSKFQSDIASIGQDYAQAAKEFGGIVNNEAITNLQKELTSVAFNGQRVTPAQVKSLLQNGGRIPRDEISPTGTIELIKKLRFDASKNYNAFDDPAKAALADAQRTAANALDGLVERNLQAAGKPELATEYTNARKQIAIAHDVESALMSDGHVSARVLNRIDQKGYLDGPLKLIADFAGAFPKAVQTPSTVGSPGVRHLKTWAAMMGGGIGSSIGGPVGAGIGAAVPFVAPPAAEGLLLSKLYQQRMASPNYAPGAIVSGAGALADNPTSLLWALRPNQ